MRMYSGSPGLIAQACRSATGVLDPGEVPMVCGKARIEEAKMTGITPPALTLSGMWVDCRP
jgi:hypothetical protein